MKPPKRSEENLVLAQQRRASALITQGVEPEIEALHELSAWKRIREIGFFAALYAGGACGAWFGQPQLLYLAGIFAMGLALNAAGILIHEGLHGLLAKNSRTNLMVSFLIGLPILMSATAYRVTHANHHYELGRKLDYGTYRQHVKNPRLVWLAYALQLGFGTVLYMLLIPPFAFRSASTASRCMMVLEYMAVIAVAVFVFLAAPLDKILTFWIYPLLVMSFFTNIRGLASHALGDPENIYLSSRTVPSSRFFSMLLLNENFHLEHHLFPSIPSYHLPAVHKLIWSRLPEALYAKSYHDFLLQFWASARRWKLEPMGVVKPASGGIGAR